MIFKEKVVKALRNIINKQTQMNLNSRFIFMKILRLVNDSQNMNDVSDLKTIKFVKEKTFTKIIEEIEKENKDSGITEGISTRNSLIYSNGINGDDTELMSGKSKATSKKVTEDSNNGTFKSDKKLAKNYNVSNKEKAYVSFIKASMGNERDPLIDPTFQYSKIDKNDTTNSNKNFTFKRDNSFMHSYQHNKPETLQKVAVNSNKLRSKHLNRKSNSISDYCFAGTLANKAAKLDNSISNILSTKDSSILASSISLEISDGRNTSFTSAAKPDEKDSDPKSNHQILDVSSDSVQILIKDAHSSSNITSNFIPEEQKPNLTDIESTVEDDFLAHMENKYSKMHKVETFIDFADIGISDVEHEFNIETQKCQSEILHDNFEGSSDSSVKIITDKSITQSTSQVFHSKICLDSFCRNKKSDEKTDLMLILDESQMIEKKCQSRYLNNSSLVYITNKNNISDGSNSLNNNLQDDKEPTSYSANDVDLQNNVNYKGSNFRDVLDKEAMKSSSSVSKVHNQEDDSLIKVNIPASFNYPLTNAANSGSKNIKRAALKKRDTRLNLLDKKISGSSSLIHTNNILLSLKSSMDTSALESTILNSFSELSIDNISIPSIIIEEKPKKNKTGKKTKFEYVPNYKSIGYYTLKALYKYNGSNKHFVNLKVAKYMEKDVSANPSFKTLLKKGLIILDSNRKYFLSDIGDQICKVLFENGRNKIQGSKNNFISDRNELLQDSYIENENPAVFSSNRMSNLRNCFGGSQSVLLDDMKQCSSSYLFNSQRTHFDDRRENKETECDRILDIKKTQFDNGGENKGSQFDKDTYCRKTECDQMLYNKKTPFDNRGENKKIECDNDLEYKSKNYEFYNTSFTNQSQTIGVKCKESNLTLPDYNARTSLSSTDFNGEILLVVDSREKKSSRDRNFFQSFFTSKGIPNTTRYLSVGDFIWIKNEQLLKCIVERKQTTDLVSSISDGRYKEQKKRLLSTGFNVFYLVENLKVDESRKNYTDRVLLEIRLSGVILIETASIKESCWFLELLDRKIRQADNNSIGNKNSRMKDTKASVNDITVLTSQSQSTRLILDKSNGLKEVSLAADHESICNINLPSFDIKVDVNQISNREFCLFKSFGCCSTIKSLHEESEMSYGSFIEDLTKNKMKVNDFFLIALLSIKGMSKELAIGLSQEYQTYSKFRQALKDERERKKIETFKVNRKDMSMKIFNEILFMFV